MAVKESSDELNPAVVVPQSAVTTAKARWRASDYVALAIATFGVGYLPLVPGTFGSLVGVALLIAMYATLWKIENHQLAFGEDSYFARTFRFTLVSIGFALLLPAASGWALRKENFCSTAIRRIALWSYGMYLVHLPVFLIVTDWLIRGTNKSLVRALFSFALQVGGTIAISAFLYHFFESRSTRLREKAGPAVAKLFASASP